MPQMYDEKRIIEKGVLQLIAVRKLTQNLTGISSRAICFFFTQSFVRFIKHMLRVHVIAVILRMVFFLLQSSVIQPRKIHLLKESISFLFPHQPHFAQLCPFNADFKCYSITGLLWCFTQLRAHWLQLRIQLRWAYDICTRNSEE